MSEVSKKNYHLSLFSSWKILFLALYAFTTFGPYFYWGHGWIGFSLIVFSSFSYLFQTGLLSDGKINNNEMACKKTMIFLLPILLLFFFSLAVF